MLPEINGHATGIRVVTDFIVLGPLQRLASGEGSGGFEAQRGGTGAFRLPPPTRAPKIKKM
jgi:hypothetical protein